MAAPQMLAEQAPAGTFHSPRSREFYDYWRRLALKRGGVPLRDDLDPAEIASLLPFLFIAEKEPDSGRFHFRLSGTGITEIMGLEHTNRYLDELLDGEDLENVMAMFDQVLDRRVCIRSVEGLTYNDRSYVRVEILRMPMCAGAGDCRLVIGCLSRIENDCRPNSITGAVKDKQVIHIENDILPRSAF
ncbi:MAG TPA: PAS domain-containing protein [Kiloniellaceae bacterium]|nr:PAS domain-containing protein [Kiloniellaceae bacterium]